MLTNFFHGTCRFQQCGKVNPEGGYQLGIFSNDTANTTSKDKTLDKPKKNNRPVGLIVFLASVQIR